MSETFRLISAREREAILLQECIAGKRKAQNELYSHFSPKMYQVCLRYSKNREEAEDTLVEGFMKVFEHLKQFKSEGSLEGWMRRIMVNTAIEKYRKKKLVFAGMLLEDRSNAFSEKHGVLEELSTKELIAMVQRLPAACQMVFNLYAFEGLKHKEIAERLGIAEGTSKSNLSDARTLLRKAVAHSRVIAKAIQVS
jgi:RNA polymerase sigma factor (sigma-70 family)